MAKSLEHLLGGYATNNLTDEEKRQLSEAALNDQALFDALADEEALKALLADPEARQRILASLQALALLEEPPSKGKSRWGWFRQQSSLAWAGSIAAMGLALIFGWQMEKEWGPIVQQEQDAAKLSSRDEVAFRQKNSPDENRTPLQKEALEKNATQVPGDEAERAVAPEYSTPTDTSNIDRLRQVPGRVKKETDAVERSQEVRSQVLNEQAAQPPPSSSLSKKQRIDRPVSPSPTSEAPELAPPEDRAPQGADSGRLPAKIAEENTLQPSNHPESAQELFYSASVFLPDDEVMEDKKGKEKADKALGRALSSASKPSLREKAFSPSMEKELGEEEPAPVAKGIRYSFVRQTKNGKEEEVDSRKISGKWKDIRLAVESNVSGYLYVVAPVGNGKWQRLESIAPSQTGKSQDWIKVKSFQRVEFSLGQVTNLLGNPIVPSLRVLISSNPIEGLDQWLGSEVDVAKFLIEQAGEAVFVVNPGTVQGNILRVDIPFENLKAE